jgi:NADPH:quinone reductase-like Zn-dependent oxidoreductase
MTLTEPNEALWLPRRGAKFQVGPAPDRAPGPGQIVVRVRAVGLNLVDAIPGFAYRFVAPWLSFPAIVGCDVAGDVIAVGSGVTRFRIGDRVLGHALGLERDRNDPAEGAFQLHVVLLEYMSSPLADDLPFERAAVLPLTLSTAATGLFQEDHLGLALPQADAPQRAETVLVWGGATAVGGNAIQLARNAGYRVVTSCSPRNEAHVRSLGAERVVDRRSATAVEELVTAVGDSPLAGSIAIGRGSLRPTVAVAARTHGTRRVVSAQPEALARMLGRLARARSQGVTVSGIWGGTLKDNEVGPAIYRDFLPAALARGDYQAAPGPVVVGHGLAAIPGGLSRVREANASKLVVTL